MIRLLSASHYLQPLQDGQPPPSLDTTLDALCREPFRRIDRFIQLALLGSARCVGARSLRPGCGVYIGSGFGPIGSNIVVQEQLLRDAHWPKPFNFINTLGASAGYYVAKNLGLDGPNMFISRRASSLQATLAASIVGLALGTVDEALVGIVEEAPYPLSHHRGRLGVGDQALLAEGSHWFLLGRDEAGGRSLAVERFADFTALAAYLPMTLKSAAWLGFTRAVDRERRTALRTLCKRSDRDPPRLPVHDSIEAAWLADRVTDPHGPEELMLVDGSDRTGWTLFHLRA